MAANDRINELLTRYYGALSRGDLASWEALHADDVAYNVNGSTAVSGRTVGKRKLLDELLPRLFTRLKPESARIGINWKCMCMDGSRAVVIFEGRSETVEGQPYNNRYLQVLEVNEAGLVSEVWEFFDTALAETVLFTPDQRPPDGTELFRY